MKHKHIRGDKKKILVYGGFDTMHRGHRRFLKRAKNLGDKLYVGVLTDSYLKKYKQEPIFNEVDRLEAIRDLSYVDNAFCVSENSYEVMMETIKPDLVVHGSDWKDAPSIQLAKKLGIKTKILKYTLGISSTEIRRRICSKLKNVKKS